MFEPVSPYAVTGMNVLTKSEHFWDDVKEPATTYELLRFSFLMGVLPFSGYLFSYTVVGKIWSTFPFIQSTLPVTRALMCAGLQWVFFATFPMLSSLLLDLVSGRRMPDPHSCAFVSTYSMMPLFVAALFVSVPFVGRILAVLGFSTFLYLVYFGYRIHLKQSVLRSGLITFFLAALFALIRQMFVFVIGF
jgi:hypothetical protein